MTYLKMLGIVCDNTQEAVDEINLVFIVDGETLSKDEGGEWGPTPIDAGETRTVLLNKAFERTFQVKLYEQDRHHSDYLGGISITPPTPDELNKEQSQVISGLTYRYRVFYILSETFSDQFELDFVSLACDNAQEAMDEVYIVVNGRQVTDPISITSGKAHEYDLAEPILFSRSATVELWEKDPFRSDRIGATVIDEDMANEAVLSTGESIPHLYFHTHTPASATYRLFYTVSLAPVIVSRDPDAPPCP